MTLASTWLHGAKSGSLLTQPPIETKTVKASSNLSFCSGSVFESEVLRPPNRTAIRGLRQRSRQHRRRGPLPHLHELFCKSSKNLSTTQCLHKSTTRRRPRAPTSNSVVTSLSSITRATRLARYRFTFTPTASSSGPSSTSSVSRSKRYPPFQTRNSRLVRQQIRHTHRTISYFRCQDAHFFEVKRTSLQYLSFGATSRISGCFCQFLQLFCRPASAKVSLLQIRSPLQICHSSNNLTLRKLVF